MSQDLLSVYNPVVCYRIHDRKFRHSEYGGMALTAAACAYFLPRHIISPGSLFCNNVLIISLFDAMDATRCGKIYGVASRYAAVVATLETAPQSLVATKGSDQSCSLEQPDEDLFLAWRPTPTVWSAWWGNHSYNGWPCRSFSA